MAKRLKLRICRAVSSTMQACRSKDPSILPQNPLPPPALPKLAAAIHFPRPSLKHHASITAPGEEFKWKKDGKWHVVDRVSDNRTHRREIKTAPEEPYFPPPPAELDKKRRPMKKKKKKRNVPSRLRASTSSGDSGWYSSEGCAGEEETETLVSSNSIMNIKRRSVRRRRGASRPPLEAEGGEVPARLSMLKRLIPCTVDGKVKESFAVVKRSENPYEDFKNSMMDMILEKEMFEERDLEQMLQCFLSLNSRHYHGIIVQAFSEIWDSIFTPHQQ